MPVTLKQLSSSRGGDEVYRVDDVELHTVKLVGTISQFHDETTNYGFKINDGTGEIDCKKWKDNDSPSIFNALREGQTARVVGTIREFAGRSHLLVYSVAPVTNFNEVTHHILDVIFTHLQNTKGKVPVCILLLFALVTQNRLTNRRSRFLPQSAAGVAPAAPSGTHSFGTPGKTFTVELVLFYRNKLQ